MKKNTKLNKRPLSPHLGIYKFAWPMLYSILQRISGFYLIGIFLWLVLWAVWAVRFPHYFGYFVLFNHYPIILLGFVGGLLSLIFHWLNGARYFFWFVGKGFMKKDARLSGHLVGAASVALLAFIIFYIWSKQ